MDGKGKNILSGSLKKSPYRGEEKTVVEIAPPVTINTKVQVQSLIDAHLYFTGQESGQLYEWGRAGAIVNVLEQDVPALLRKRLGKKTCCGNGDNLVFQLV